MIYYSNPATDYSQQLSKTVSETLRSACKHAHIVSVNMLLCNRYIPLFSKTIFRRRLLRRGEGGINL